MTTLADIRQTAQWIGLKLTALILKAILWVLDILWSIVREIINGVFRVVIGIIVIILSLVGFFAFILWLLTI